MLCRRCKELFWDLEHERIEEKVNISQHRPARSLDIELRQHCNACKFFYGPNHLPQNIRAQISWFKTHPNDYVLTFNTHDSKRSRDRVNGAIFQVTQIGPRYGSGTLETVNYLF
jgi:hypothetical protein